MDEGKAGAITRVVKLADHEHPGWNEVEVIARGDELVHIVNGVVVNRAAKPRLPDPQSPDLEKPLPRGRIVLQAEGAEVLYRNVELRAL